MGTKTSGVKGETLTQAAVVEALLRHISPKNRLMDDIKAGKASNSKMPFTKHKFKKQDDDVEELVLRQFFIDEREADIGILIIRYFKAVKSRWENVWNNSESGWVLNKTNGFLAFMQFFKLAYKHIAKKSGELIEEEDFRNFFKDIDIPDETFRTDKALPGAGGQKYIFDALLEASNIDKNIRWRKV